MLFDDDVVTNGQAEAGTLSGGFSCEEGIEHLFPHLGHNTYAVVAYTDLYPVTEVFRSGCKLRLEAIVSRLSLTLGRGIEAVGDQVQEGPRDLPADTHPIHRQPDQRIAIVKNMLLQLIMVPAPRSRASRSIWSVIEALLDERIDIDRPMFARAFARVDERGERH